MANFKEVDHPITTEQYGIMVHLWIEDGVSQQDLCCATGKDKPSVTRLLDNLEKIGLIRRESCPGDRRKNLIYLTEEGKEIKDSSTDLALKTLNEMTDFVDPNELELAKKVMREIIGQFERFE